ncbi:CCA tRNA nucleotidyltransferase [Planctomycetales bacterium ZRK34]|nr:CCA tRNA nucleotidyltransferase [Planctomycetales bacterium ZRK34]
MGNDDQQPIEPQRARAAAEAAVRRLQQQGHVAYFAGGCVRDQIMGAQPVDYDIATDAPPDVVRGLFKPAHLVGQAFGVVRVRVDGVWLEVATFRLEWGYADGRRPDHVEFTDAEHDAQRRDFTINGLFYDPVADRVIDYVDGQRDIERRVIRAIGVPGERFAEDYLRMLRAARFAARLNFEIDPATAEAIKVNASKLGQISRERIGAELQLMFEREGRAHAARWIDELHLDAPSLNGQSVDREPICLTALDEAADYPAALAAWVIDRHMDPHRPADRVALVDALDRIKVVQIARRWRGALMLSNDQRDGLQEALLTLPRMVMWADLNTAQRKRLMAREDWARLSALLKAVLTLCPHGDFDMAGFDRDTAALAAEGVAPTPLITGDDLVAAGLSPGPMFKQILDHVYDAQLTGSVDTFDQAMQLAKALAER